MNLSLRHRTMSTGQFFQVFLSIGHCAVSHRQIHEFIVSHRQKHDGQCFSRPNHERGVSHRQMSQKLD
jgi:hypothetical protein